MRWARFWGLRERNPRREHSNQLRARAATKLARSGGQWQRSQSVRPSVLLPYGLYATLVTTAAAPALATAKRTTPRARAALKLHARAEIERSESRAKAEAPEPAQKRTARSRTIEKESSSIIKASLSVESSAPARHRVLAGETLGTIAARHNVTVAALCTSNGLSKNANLRVGQILTLPKSAKRTQKSWDIYAKPTQRKGYLDVSTPISRFAGPVLDSDGRLRTSAVRTLNELLGAGGTHPALPERLIRLLVEVSDTFAGRPIRLVSGYRTSSYYQDSRHKQSSAIDFLIVGVPNAVVCDYLREFEDVGVGYYPNSSFVHMDVRNHSAYWVDYAGPGEPPRSTPDAPPAPRTPRSADRKLLAELDGLLKQTHRAIAEVQANDDEEH